MTRSSPTTALFKDFIDCVWGESVALSLVWSLAEWPDRVRRLTDQVAGHDAPGVGVHVGAAFIGYRFIAPSEPAPHAWFVVEATREGRLTAQLVPHTDQGWDFRHYQSALGLTIHSRDWPGRR